MRVTGKRHLRIYRARLPNEGGAGTHLSIEGNFVDSRRIGDTLYLVSTHAPRLAAEVLPATATAAEREAAIQNLKADDILPRLRRNGGPLLKRTSPPATSAGRARSRCCT